MPTFDEIKGYAEEKFTFADQGDGWFSLVFGFDDDRSQLIVVSQVKVFGNDWLRFASAICDEGGMDPKQALELNARLPIGAIHFEDGRYLLGHNAPLATMDEEEFNLPLMAIAQIADKFEADHVGTDEY